VGEKIICLTFDIEDWFQVENLREKFPPAVWPDCESRVENNTKKILTLLDKYNIKGTFFILGWIAERFPNLVKEISSKGHEIASHGYGHIINYQLSNDKIVEDIKKSKEILENITDQKVKGYRAPNFSITENIMATLKEFGFQYDSSYHPFSKNKRYGQIEMERNGYFYRKNEIIEVPLSVLKNNLVEIPIGGGGYFRLYPYPIFKQLSRYYFNKQDYLVMYFHPWEFDPEQPKVRDIKLSYRFRHYVGLKKNFSKLDKFIQSYVKKEFKFKRLIEIIHETY
jgi:polysaccharide deacetylase family protein (PEP-CTERM system associated)